jgi:hypothetical protein
MTLSEQQLAAILEDVIDETLDIKQRDRDRFENALFERLREEAVFSEEELEESDDSEEEE